MTSEEIASIRHALKHDAVPAYPNRILASPGSAEFVKPVTSRRRAPPNGLIGKLRKDDPK
jgi:hypothetical protein